MGCGRSRMPLTVYVPEHAPRTKLDAIRIAGADVKVCRDYDEAGTPRQGARGRRARRSSSLRTATRTSSRARERSASRSSRTGPTSTAIVVPIGGGGLVSGIAIACSGGRQRTSVVGVEAEASSPFTQSLAAGRIVEIDVRPNARRRARGQPRSRHRHVRHRAARWWRRIALVDEDGFARAQSLASWSRAAGRRRRGRRGRRGRARRTSSTSAATRRDRSVGREHRSRIKRSCEQSDVYMLAPTSADRTVHTRHQPPDARRAQSERARQSTSPMIDSSADGNQLGRRGVCPLARRARRDPAQLRGERQRALRPGLYGLRERARHERARAPRAACDAEMRRRRARG